MEWKKGKMEKDGKNKSQNVFVPIIYFVTLKLYTKFEDSGSHRSRKSVAEINWRERKIDK